MAEASVVNRVSSNVYEEQRMGRAGQRAVPSGNRVMYEDDLVEVYDAKGNLEYSGMLDYTDYKNDTARWNDKDKNYDLPNGYKMVGLTRH